MKTIDFLEHSHLGRALRAFRPEFMAVGVFSLVANLLMLTPTFYMLQIYDRAMVSQNTMTLWAVTLVALFFLAAMAFAEWMRTKVLISAGIRFDEMLHQRVFNANFDASMDRTRRNPVEAFNDLANLRQFLTGNGIFAVFDLPWTPIYLVVAWLLHPLIGLLALFCLIISALVAWAGHRVIHQGTRDAQLAQQKAASFAHEKLHNAEVVEAMGMFAPLRRRWLEMRDAASREGEAAADRAQRMHSLSKGVRYAQQSLMLAAGAALVTRGELTPGGMIAANVLMARALHPVEMLGGQWKSFLLAGLAFRRLEELLAQYPGRRGKHEPAQCRGEIRVEKLVATMPGRTTPILREIDASFPAGKLVLIIGPSGSGKSTLARCLLGLWPHQRGSVSLDDIPLESWEPTALGRKIGYLPQDVELLEGTIAENIARFGEVDSEKVIAAAIEADVHRMVLRFPKGYDTPIGEAGSLLSAGQRQRIALARALYGSPALLVLDEPNSNLDEAGEAALLKALRSLHEAGRSVFVISHRLLALDSIDWVVVLKAGRLTHQGTPDEIFGQLLPPRNGQAALPPAGALQGA